MLKNKFKIILAFILIITLAFCPLVKADDEDVDNEEYAEETSVEETVDNEDSNGDEEIKESDVYLFGDKVTVDYTVDGNVFVCANTVDIKAKISGDVFICANTVNIENSYIYSNLFVVANNLNLNAVIYDLYACCSNIEVKENGYIYRDARIACNNVNFYGTVGRNAYIDTSTMSLSNSSNDENSESLQATIYGDLNYTADNELDISDSIVEGKINFTKQTSNSNENSIGDIILSIITSMVFAVLVYLVLIWLAPNFVNKLNETLKTKIGPIIGFGALALIVVPIVSVILMITAIGISAGFLLITLYGILMAVSSTILIITISNIISDKTNIDNKFIKIAIVAGVSLVFALLKLIPFVNGLIILISVWLGAGITVKQLLPSKEK